MRRALLLGLPLVAVLAAVAAFLIRSRDADDLGAIASRLLERRLGGSVQAARTTLRPGRGLVMEDVVMRPRLAGGQVELHVDRLELETAGLRFLGGPVRIARATLVRPRLEIVERTVPEGRRGAPVSRPERAAAPVDRRPPVSRVEEPIPGADRIAAEIHEVRIEDGVLIVRSGGSAPRATLEGLHLVLADVVLDGETASVLAGLSASGDLAIGSASLEVGRLDEARGRLEISDGRLLLSDVAFRSRLGAFTAAGEIGLMRAPFEHGLTVAADPLDLHALTGSPESAGFGHATLTVESSGRGTDPGTLTGSGTLRIGAGTLPYFPLLTQLEAALRRLSLWEAPYADVEAPFQLVNGRLDFAPFAVRSDGFDVRVAGLLGLDGELDLRLDLEADRERVSMRNVPDDVERALTIAPGRLGIPVRIGGSADEPRVEPDVDAIVSRALSRGEAVDEGRLRAALQEMFGAQS